MIRYELFCITLVSLIYYTTCKTNVYSAEANTTNKGEPPDKLILHKSQPYSRIDDQQSFMSNLVTWIFPFGRQSEERSDTTNTGLQYFSAPSSQSHIEKDCNPCNRAPWIPITSNVAEKTVINFVPSTWNFGHGGDYNDLTVFETLHPPPISYSTPIMQYGPPPPQFRPKYTKNNYGASKQRLPAQIYPPPNKDDIVVIDYMVPPPINYRIPTLIYGPHKSSYIPQRTKPIQEPPPDKILYGPPRPIHTSAGLNTLYSSPQVFIPPPPTLHNNHPSNVHSVHLGNIPPSSFSSSDFTDINQPFNIFNEAFTNKNIPVVPSDSYGAPVTGDSLNYVSPPEQLSSPNEHRAYVHRPIPLPNLSSFPVLPIRNFGNFKENFVDSQHDDVNVAIQPSVKVADYLATIEHPINVIQSPLIELSIKDDSYDDNEYPDQSRNNKKSVPGYSREDNNLHIHPINRDPYNSQTHTEQNIYISEEKVQKTYDNIEEKLEDSDNHATPANLSENPIVVEDIHVAASSNNGTFIKSEQTKSDRGNGKDLDVQDTNLNLLPPNQLEVSTGTDIIKGLLLKQKITSLSPSVLENSNRVGIRNNFTVSPLDYGNWRPTYGVTMTNFKVPPNAVQPLTLLSENPTATTKQPKILQIIVPYVTGKESVPFKKDWKNKYQKHLPQSESSAGAYTTLLPVYVPPSTTEDSIWSRFVDDFNALESKPIIATAIPKTTTAVYNIKELLNTRTETISKVMPYDMNSLQKHIDYWTQQAYSQNTQKGKEKLSMPKKIPSEYFTTQESNTTAMGDQLFYRSSLQKGKSVKEVADNYINTDLLAPAETATEKTTTTSTKSSTESGLKADKSLWDASHVTISPQTREKVYLVTPQGYSLYTSTPATAWSAAPKIENGKINNASTYDSLKFSIRVEPQNKTSREKLKKDTGGVVKIVYSEWPHLINNLQTTTTMRPTSRHPLFGLMDSLASTIRSNATVETIFGHSQLADAVTSTAVSKMDSTRKSSGAGRF